MPTGQKPATACAYQHRPIELKCDNGCSAGGRQTLDFSLVGAPFKVYAPVLHPGVEQRRNFSGLGIRGLCLRGFELVARATGQPQIVARRGAACRNGDEMVEGQGDSAQCLIRLTVATAVTRIFGHLTPQIGRDMGWRHGSDG